MDCRTCRELLPELCNGTLEESMTASARTHLARCAHCRAELGAEELLEELLTATPLRQPPLGFTTAVLARLEATPRRQSSLVPWLETLATMFSTVALAVGLRPVVHAWAWMLRPMAVGLTTARILGIAAGRGPGWTELPLSLPPHLPLPDPFILQVGGLAAAAVMTLSLITLWIVGWALARP